MRLIGIWARARGRSNNPGEANDMEFPAYLTITLICLAVLYWSTRNAGRKPGTPVTGLFMYREAEPPTGAKMGEDGTAPDRPLEPSGRWNGAR